VCRSSRKLRHPWVGQHVPARSRLIGPGERVSQRSVQTRAPTLLEQPKAPDSARALSSTRLDERGTASRRIAPTPPLGPAGGVGRPASPWDWCGRGARSVRFSLVLRRRADAAWLNRSDGRAPPRPDRVLRPLRGAAQRCRSGGAHPRGVGGRRQRRRGRPRGGRHLRRARERRARVHQVDARALSAARRGRAAGPQATCGRLTPSAFADSRRPAAPGKAGWRSPRTPGVVGGRGRGRPDPPQPAPTWLLFAAQPAGATDGSRACADRGSLSCASGRCRGRTAA
jgi:hypothetical protein